MEYVRDWRPFDYATVDRKRGPITVRETVQLEPIPEGTRVHWRAQFHAPLPLWLLRKICTFFALKGMKMESNAELLRRTLSEHVASTAPQQDDFVFA